MNDNLPDIYLFNPTCDYAIANGNVSWQPNKLLRKMESDLATLPMFFSGKKDYVLVDILPSEEFINTFENLDIELPNFIHIKEALNNQNFLNLPKGKLFPWGWSPAAHQLFEPLKQNCSEEFLNSPVTNWKPQYKNLYSKRFALKILNELLTSLNSQFLITNELLPQACTTIQEMEKLINRCGKIMVKAPWSSSGRGLQPVTKTPVHKKVWERILGMINEQGYVIAEPFLNKVADYALQFNLSKGKVTFLGVSNFFAGKNGQYQGNYLGGFPEKYGKQLSNFIRSISDRIVLSLTDILQKSELASMYEGNFGVDTLIFYDQNNNLKINPCLEINVRHSMGLLSLQLEKFIYPNTKAKFQIFYEREQALLQFKREMEKKHPLSISSGKLISGFFPLTEIRKNTLFGAYLLL